MLGIKIIKQGILKYEFAEIILPINEIIKEYYWIITESSISINYYSKDKKESIEWEENYDDIVIDNKEDADIKLLSKGFMNKYAQFIFGDWTEIAAVKRRSIFNEITTDSFDKKFIENNVDIYFSCIDAMYWEVYSKNKTLLDLIVKQFPFSTYINLAEKKW